MGVKDLIEGGMLTWHCEESLNALEEDGEAQGEKENSVDQSTWRKKRRGKRSAFGWLGGGEGLLRDSPRISARCQPYEYLAVEEAVASRIA